MTGKNVVVILLVLGITFTLFNCDTGGGGNISIDSKVSNSAQFGEITVTVLEDGRRLDSDKTDDGGNFNLRFRSNTGFVSLRFESDSFDAERPNLRVTDDSTILFDFTLQQNPTLITINSWQVLQDPLFLRNESELVFNEKLADIAIDADGGDCLIGTGSSVITFRVKSITIINCREGVRVQGTASVILEADEDITVSSNRDAVISFDDTFVRIGETSDPVDNSVLIQSANLNGINAAGNSVVEIDPQNNQCSISGGRRAVNVSGNASVDTDGCTLSDG
ncbi:MAG: hypothetical protein RIG61_00565 [Deltaproteobacteria bacterium]